MATEIRIVGKVLVVYTDNTKLYRYLNKYLRPIKKVRYAQNGKIVGYDFYYDADKENVIRQVINGQLLLELT